MNTDMFFKTDTMFEKQLRELEKQGFLRSLQRVESASSRQIVVGNRTCLNLSSNNYLGMADHPRLKEAAIQAVRQFGIGTGASALISGHTRLHEELSRRIAAFKGTEAALLFNTGYMANAGLLSAILEKGDTVFVDRLSHASLIDGCRLSGAALRVYPHRDTKTLARRLERTSPPGRIWIVTDGVFSMDGDLAPLPEIVSLAGKHRCLVIVDDAHATGVLGANGRGTLEHFGLFADPHIIQMGTFSKAFGSFGAYVAGSQSLIAWLINRARAYIYTTNLPAALAAASLASLELIEKQPEIRQRLWKNRDFYERGVRALGYQTLQSETPIIPLHIGNTECAVRMSQRLLEHGIFAPAIRPPTVPEGTARIRTSVMSTHTREDLDQALTVLGQVGKEVGIL